MENQARLAAFEWLKKQVQLYGDVLPRKLLEAGFNFNGERITLLGAQGIWKPKSFELPISITTVYSGPYDDALDSRGFIVYKYRGTDPNHRDNVGLSKAMLRKTPLIYFHGIAKSKYLVEWPVYIIENHPDALSFTVSVDLSSNYSNETSAFKEDNVEYIQRAYVTASIKQRLHQRIFRDRVIEAYQTQCAMCRFNHVQLLDAAHIVPDSAEKGEPVISNGLSLCKMHHAAYDRDLIGITPDYQIVVRPDILQEQGGDMLKYGFQKLHGQQIWLPKSVAKRPDQERLEWRYKRFGEVAK